MAILFIQSFEPTAQPSPEESLKLSVQISRNGEDWTTSDAGEFWTMVKFIAISKSCGNNHFGMMADPNSNSKIFGLFAVSWFPIEEYLQFRLKQFEAESSAFTQPSDASKLMAKMSPKRLVNSCEKLAGPNAAIKSEFSL